MIYELARDVGLSLEARKFPVRVVYGPERTAREGYDPVIVIERDRAGSDSLEPAHGFQRNPRKVMTRMRAVRATIYAASPLPGAMIQDHERECEKLVDALLVAIHEWQTAERAGVLAVTEARYMSASERNDVETWPGVVYVLRFRVPFAVQKLTYLGTPRPEAVLDGVSTNCHTSVDTITLDVTLGSLTVAGTGTVTS